LTVYVFFVVKDHTGLLKDFHLLADAFCRKPVLGDRVPRYTAALFKPVINMNFESLAGKVIGGAEPGGAGADNCNLFPVWFTGLSLKSQDISERFKLLAGKSFEPSDGN